MIRQKCNDSQNSLNKTKGSLYTNSTHTIRAFEVLQSLRKDVVLCDIKLETEDGTIVDGHKNVLASVCPYFRAMFTNFEESNKDHVIMREIDSTALKLLVDFIYTSKLIVTEDNVQVLLTAASLLQLDDVQDVCCTFLQSRLRPENCIGIKSLADKHDYLALLSSSELYIRQHFSKVVECDEFLSLSAEQVIQIISSDELMEQMPREEKVFESVICWVNDNLSCRKDILPKLIEHVRFALIPREYLLNRVKKEPILQNIPEINNYIFEALHFQLLKYEQTYTLPISIHSTPRQPAGLSKVILVVSVGCSNFSQWYNPEINQWQGGRTINKHENVCSSIVVLKNQVVFAIGGTSDVKTVSTVDMFDLSSSSPCWVSTTNMLAKRQKPAVAVLDNFIYAVGGYSCYAMKSAEVFNCYTREWHWISDMSTRRSCFSIGVLNNLIYAVGGKNDNKYLNTVECYHPTTDIWKPVAEMAVSRATAGVGVLNGILYVVGGCNDTEFFKSVETFNPSAGMWSPLPDMNKRRRSAEVVAFDGLLYVMGGWDGVSCLDSVEIYNPHSNTWSMLSATMDCARSSVGVLALTTMIEAGFQKKKQKANA